MSALHLHAGSADPAPGRDAADRIRSMPPRFAGRQVEDRFRASRREAVRRTGRIWAICAVTYYTGYSAALGFHTGSSFFETEWFRIAVCIPLLVLELLLAVRQPLSGRAYDAYFLLVAFAAFANAGVGLATAAGPDRLMYLLEMAVIFVFCQNYFRASFGMVTVYSALCLSLAVWAFSVIAEAPETADFPQIGAVIVSVSIVLIGLGASHAKEILMRRNYRAMQQGRRGQAQAEMLAREAAAADDAQSRFLAMTGQDLTAPLDDILNLSDQAGEVEPERAREYFGHIHASGRRLRDLLENVQVVTRSGTGILAPHTEPVDLRAALRAAARRHASAFAGRHMAVSHFEDAARIRVSADPAMVDQILDHLISNAVKFGQPHGQVMLALADGPAGETEIVVGDDGAGIPADYREAVFEPFFQIDNGLDRRHEGLGLGLTLAQGLASAQGARIEIRPRRKGLAVAVVFPADRTIPDGQGASGL